MRTAFFNAVRESLFDGSLSQRQVDCFNAIFEAWQTYGSDDDNRLAYVLATAYHETARFKYMREIWGPTAAQKRYEGRDDLGNVQKGDGKKFLGRGFVQITGRRNYADWSKRLGIDLLKEPDLAEELYVASRILVEGMVLGTFTGKKLADYIGAGKLNLVGARYIVNGQDRAVLISGYAVKFANALASKPVAGQERPPATQVPPDPALPRTEAPSLWAALLNLILSLFKRKKTP